MLVQYLRDVGCEASSCGVRGSLLDARKIRESDVIFVNFIDLLSKTGALRKAKHMVSRIALALRLGNSPAKLVYVVHNIYHHEGTDRERDIFLRRMFAKRADAIVVLSDKGKDVLRTQLGSRDYASIESRIVKIPFPNYVDQYASSGRDFRKELGIAEEEFVIAFTGGLLRPYKNFELVVELARAFEKEGLKARFVLSGSAPDEKTRSRYEALCSSVPSIHFLHGYVPEEDLFDFVAAGNVMICPFDESALDSSTCILAFSCGRNVIAPSIGTIQEVPEGLVYSYRRPTERGEFDSLKDAAIRAYGEFHADRGLFESKQDSLLEYVTSAWSTDIVRGKYKELLRSLGIIGDSEVGSREI